jgi:hypothetical protein
MTRSVFEACLCDPRTFDIRVRICVVFDVIMATGYLYMTAYPAEVSVALLGKELSTPLVLI